MDAYPANLPDVVDLGGRHFLRAHHHLVRGDEPLGTPVLANADTEVIGVMWWHDCRAEESRWLLQPLPAEVLVCPFAGCGERGQVVAGQWVAA